MNKLLLYKFQLTSLYTSIRGDWPKIKALSSSLLGPNFHKIAKEPKFGHEQLATLTSYSAASFNNDYLYGVKFFDKIIDIGGETKLKEFYEKGDLKTQETLLHGPKWERQKAMLDLVCREFPIFSWDEKLFRYEIKLPTLLPSELNTYIKSDLPDGFVDTDWFLYKHVKGGMERLTLAFRKSSDGRSHVVTINEPKNEAQDDFEENQDSDQGFAGLGFIDTQDSTKNRIIILLNRGTKKNKKYGHLILFTKGSLNDDTIFTGHFTYFASNSNGRRYLTKSVVISLSKGDMPFTPQRFRKGDGLVKMEKLFFHYLQDRAMNTLMSISSGSEYNTPAEFSRWLLKQRKSEQSSGEILDLTEYNHVQSEKDKTVLDFFLCYTKKNIDSDLHDTDQIKIYDTVSKSQIVYEFFANKMEIVIERYSPYIKVRYYHANSKSAFKDPDHSETKFKEVFEGNARISNGFIYALLERDKTVPIYVTIGIYGPNIPDNRRLARLKEKEYFIGSITGVGDGDTVMVTCTCILVPSILVHDDEKNPNIKETVKKYLNREAQDGWSVVNPSNEKVWGTKIDELRQRGGQDL